MLQLDNDEKRLLLARISRSIGFENFLAKKWPGEKRFGLEGVEMLIPCMKQVIDRQVRLYDLSQTDQDTSLPQGVPGHTHDVRYCLLYM